ncbi:arginine deiminase-related protein [Limibacter armeniacum]|uniref:citrulline utilization hydrolase CtlX n=1 Tax=Limibacter armeniacum TaxID=466084 RepID=UPI002FE60961
MMVRPAAFGFNTATAIDNAFQNKEAAQKDAEGIKQRAQAEFDFFVSRLREAGVYVHVIEDTATPVKPDAIFPNNWITTHEDGKVVLYPMKAENRRLERREDIVTALSKEFKIADTINVSAFEQQGKFLEGTGSMIFDRVNKICYACISQRTEPQLLSEINSKLGYEIVSFTSKDENGQDIYHTNVMLSVATDFAIICGASIPDANEKKVVLDKLSSTGKEIIDVTFEQMRALCCNVLEVTNKQGEKLLTMSKRAFDAFSDDQKAVIEKSCRIVMSPIPVIEEIGGGGSRCMMAEIYLPENK